MGMLAIIVLTVWADLWIAFIFGELYIESLEADLAKRQEHANMADEFYISLAMSSLYSIMGEWRELGKD